MRELSAGGRDPVHGRARGAREAPNFMPEFSLHHHPCAVVEAMTWDKRAAQLAAWASRAGRQPGQVFCAVRPSASPQGLPACTASREMRGPTGWSVWSLGPFQLWYFMMKNQFIDDRGPEELKEVERDAEFFSGRSSSRSRAKWASWSPSRRKSVSLHLFLVFLLIFDGQDHGQLLANLWTKQFLCLLWPRISPIPHILASRGYRSFPPGSPPSYPKPRGGLKVRVFHVQSPQWCLHNYYSSFCSTDAYPIAIVCKALCWALGQYFTNPLVGFDLNLIGYNQNSKNKKNRIKQKMSKCLTYCKGVLFNKTFVSVLHL